MSPGLRREAIGLGLAAALLLLPGLGAVDLWAPDEPRFARVADELRSGEHGATGLVLLHLNGEPYTQKPPLYYWLAALIGAPFGRVDELAARLPSALAGIGCVLATLLLGRRLWPDTRAGLMGAALLLTVFRFAHQARRASLDVLLSLFMLIALSAAWRVLTRTDEERGRSRRDLLLLHGCVGLGVLTKGPVALLVYGVLVLFLGWERRIGALRTLFPWWSVPLALGPALLWISAAASLAPPGFIGEALVDNVLARFLSGTAHVRPFYYYLYQLPLDFLPWTLLLPAVWPLARSSGRTPASRFLLAWAGGLLLFFSLSAGKRGLYLLPAYPALALFCGAALERALTASGPRRWPARSGAALLALLGLCGIALALAPDAFVPEGTQVVLPRSLGVAIAAAAGWGLVAARSRGPLAWIAAVGIIELAAFVWLYPALDPEKSPRPIAEAAARATAADEPVAVYRHRALAAGVAHYSGRPTRSFESPDALARFLAVGGRVVVLKARHAADLEALGSWITLAESRSGRRRLQLAIPAARAAPPGQAEPPSQRATP